VLLAVAVLGWLMLSPADSPVPQDAHKSLHDLYRVWDTVTSRGHLPSVDDIMSDEGIASGDTTMVLRVDRDDRDQPRFTYTHAGPRQGQVFGRPIVGFSVDELVPPQQIAHFVNVFRDILTSKKPHYWMRMNGMFDGAFRTYERLVVPVSTDGESVDGFVGVWNWVD